MAAPIPAGKQQPPLGDEPPLWSGAFVVLLAVQFTFGTAFSSFFVLPKYLIEVLGADASLVGNSHGVFALVGVVLVPWVGGALDRFGRRSVLLAGALVGVVSFAAFGQVREPWAILGLRAAHGLSFALTFNAGAALTVDLAPQSRRAEAIGYFGTAMLSTNALGPWLSEIIAEALGWPYAFIGCSFYSLLAVGFALLLPRTRSAPPNHRPKGTHHVGLLAAYIGSVALGIGVGSSKTFIPALLVESGAARIAPYFIAFTLGALIQRTLFGWLPDRLGHLRASGCALSLYGLSMLLVLLLDVSWVFWISVLIGIAHGMGYPAIGALAVSLGDPAARGRVTAWVTGGFNLGFAISTAGFARLEPGLGYAGLVALGGGSLLFAAVLVPALVARHERTLRRDPERIAVP